MPSRSNGWARDGRARLCGDPVLPDGAQSCALLAARGHGKPRQSRLLGTAPARGMLRELPSPSSAAEAAFLVGTGGLCRAGSPRRPVKCRGAGLLRLTHMQTLGRVLHPPLLRADAHVLLLWGTYRFLRGNQLLNVFNAFAYIQK